MLTKQIFNFYPDSISFTPTFSKMKALEPSIVLKWNHGEQILCLYTVFESAVQIRVSTCCQQIPGRLPNQEFQVLGSEGLHGPHPHPTGKHPARYRYSAQCTCQQTVPHRHQTMLEVYPCRCKRTT